MKKFILSILLIGTLLSSGASSISAQAATAVPVPAPIVVTEPASAPVVSPVDNGGTVIVEPSVAPDFGQFSPMELVIIVILLGVIVGVGYLLKVLLDHNHELATKLENAVPPWLWASVQAGVDKGLDAAGVVVAATANPVDDELFATVKTLVEKALADVQHPPTAPTPAPTVVQTTVSVPPEGQG